MKLNKERMYEITDVEKRHIWYVPLGHSSCIVGTVIKIKAPTCDISLVTIVRQNANRFPVSTALNLDIVNLTLRPLNQKDQAKIEENLYGS